MHSCTRKLEFDAAHRVLRHESKCRHVHGHRYVLEVTAEAAGLDDVGRVVDFGVLKQVLGGWVDEHLDHGYIAHPDDDVAAHLKGKKLKVYTMPTSHPNPTAENMVSVLAGIFQLLLDEQHAGLVVSRLRLYETPNCWADWAQDP